MSDTQTVYYFSEYGGEVPGPFGPDKKDILIGLLTLAGLWLLFRLMGVR